MDVRTLLGAKFILKDNFIFFKTLYELVRSNSNSIWEAGLINTNDSTNSLKHLNLGFKNTKKPSQKDSKYFCVKIFYFF